MSAKRILFVDDEPYLLDGLRNALRKQRRVWDMVFATSGPEGLRAFESGAFDVVISDMRMPGMDGAQFLEIVRDRHPGVARIVLSGHAEREAVVRTLAMAHQYLSKPCDAEHLRQVIDRVCNLQGLLHHEDTRRVVGRVAALPSVPSSYTELTRLAGSSTASVMQVAEIVETDPAMAAKVLQMVNSAYFGLCRPTTSILDAVRYLGLDLIKTLAMTSHIFSTAAGRRIQGLSLEALQEHSLMVARLARRIVADRALADEAFTAGMVHDLGRIVLAMIPGPVPSRDASRGPEQPDLEREVFGVSHAEAGAYLLGIWGLPFPIIESAAYHHTPHLVAEGARDTLVAVHLAEAFASAACGVLVDPKSLVDTAFLESTGRLGQLDAWWAVMSDELDSFKAVA